MTDKPKRLTWDDIADLYDAKTGGRAARTQPMDVVVNTLLTQGLITTDAAGFYVEMEAAK